MGVNTSAPAHALRCKCGAVQGRVDIPGTSNRVVCYCKSCQLFAHYLGNPQEILDRNGGTEVIQIAASRISLTSGAENIAAIRLTDRGLVRWYAGCCNTPIGNTLENYKFSFVGLIHSCLNSQALAPSFGEFVARVNTASAVGEPRPSGIGLPGTFARILAIVIPKRLSGEFRITPFFSRSGVPVARPRVLNTVELERLQKAL